MARVAYPHQFQFIPPFEAKALDSDGAWGAQCAREDLLANRTSNFKHASPSSEFVSLRTWVTVTACVGDTCTVANLEAAAMLSLY
jgi:hypothetical protein